MTARSGLFHREWFRNPLQVGAVAPSSSGLARAITQGLEAKSSQVLELGPGTGVFTRKLIERGTPAAQITAIEANHRFATNLKQVLPDVEIIYGDASRMRSLLAVRRLDIKTVICGLPLLSMGLPRVFRIMSDSFRVLSDDGEFRLFTYEPSCPVPGVFLDRLDLRAHRKKFVPRNIPPASVYIVMRRTPG